MTIKHGLLLAVAALVAWPPVSTATAVDAPIARAALATCDDHPNQASAQRAKDTRDADSDGIYCETLPCPCLPPDPRAGSTPPPPPPPPPPAPTPAPTPTPMPTPTPTPEPESKQDAEPKPDVASGCVRPRRVQRIIFSARKYPTIRRHFRAAIRRGWPRRLVINRRGTDARRDRLLEDYPTREGRDRDEYPPVVGRGKGKGLMRGRNPRGWKASVRYVPSSENRSHGATLGNALEEFCNGTRFRYVFR